MPMIEAGASADGALTYFIEGAPSCLPPVLKRDLLLAWEAARSAALARTVAGRPRAFRFARPDGGTTDLALSDPDALCWAAALDRKHAIASPYGLSVCLRLLALINLLAAFPWARAHMALRPGGAELAPSLLRLAAEAKLTDDASFDDAVFLARLSPALAARPEGQGAARP